MSLIIEGMKMPKFRDVHSDGRGTVYLLMLTVNKDGTAYIYTNTGDNEFHQVKELSKPHGRLIDADKAATSILMMNNHPCGNSIETVNDVVEWLRFADENGNNVAFPTIIEAEVN